MVLIGSMALHYYGVLSRDPNDIDIVMTLDNLRTLAIDKEKSIKSLIPVKPYKYSLDTVSGIHYDISIDYHPTDSQLIEESDKWDDVYHDKHLGIDVKVPPIEWLLQIKRSHLHCDPKRFETNIADYHILRSEVRSRGLEIDDKIKNFLKERIKESEKHFAYKAPSLNVTNEEFFESSSKIIGYEFVHDDLHEALKFGDVPVYEKMKNDLSSAMCDRDMFFMLTHEERLQAVMEEAYVIAVERYLLKEDISARDAFVNAMGRICTNLCSGFFRDYAIDHYFEAMVEYDTGYANKVLKAYQAKKLRKLLPDNEVSKAIQLLKRNLTEH